MGAPDIITIKEITQKTKAVDIDTALTLTHHKWFHWKLLLIGSFAFLATGFEFTLHAYILPFAECDLNINAADMGIINALFLGGGLVSSLFWGVMADTVGRRKVLVISTILEGLGTIVVSWSSSFYMFAAIRTFCGFLCGGAATVLLSYIGEFCSDKIRPRNICLLGFAWTMSWMLMPGLAALVIPLRFKFETGFITYKPWRLFVAIVGIPNIISGICLRVFLPESPKYFFAKGDESTAIAILQKMYAANTGNPPETYSVTRLSTGIPEIDNNSLIVDFIKKKVQLTTLVSNMFSQMQALFRPPLLWSTILSCSVYMCGMFGYYGLGLWLPAIFDRLEEFRKVNPNDTVSLCELSRAAEDAVNKTFAECGERTINLAIFTNTFIMGAACFVGNLIATYMATKMQVRILAAIFLEVGGACVIILYFINSPAAIVAVSSIFMGSVNAGLSVHNTCAINLFPTSIRGMGVCISFLFGRVSAVLSSLVFGMLIDRNCAIPVILVATSVLIGGGFCMLIPKSSQKARE